MNKLLRNTMVLIVLSLFCLNAPAWANINVTPEEAKALIDSTPDIIIVDIRPEAYYCDEGGHIPGAVNYPIDGYFQNNYTDFPIDATILVYCTWSVPSEQAASILDDAGYLNVYDMPAGMPGWTYEAEYCCVDDNDCDDDLFCTGVETCVAGECVNGPGNPCEANETCDEGSDECICFVEWDLNGDCFVDKEDAKLLKIRQKDEKTDLKERHKAEKAEMKAAL